MNLGKLVGPSLWEFWFCAWSLDQMLDLTLRSVFQRLCPDNLQSCFQKLRPLDQSGNRTKNHNENPHRTWCPAGKQLLPTFRTLPSTSGSSPLICPKHSIFFFFFSQKRWQKPNWSNIWQPNRATITWCFVLFLTNSATKDKSVTNWQSGTSHGNKTMDGFLRLKGFNFSDRC